MPTIFNVVVICIRAFVYASTDDGSEIFFWSVFAGKAEIEAVLWPLPLVCHVDFVFPKVAGIFNIIIYLSVVRHSLLHIKLYTNSQHLFFSRLKTLICMYVGSTSSLSFRKKNTKRTIFSSTAPPS